MGRVITISVDGRQVANKRCVRRAPHGILEIVAMRSESSISLDGARDGLDVIWTFVPEEGLGHVHQSHAVEYFVRRQFESDVI